MRVEILKVLDPSQGIVSFRCAYGAALARWMGADPARQGTFDVEIEVPEAVAEWVPVASGSVSLEGLEHFWVRITGEVVGVGEGDDPVVEIRVGSDVLLIEIPDRRPELHAAHLVSFRAAEVQLYPYDL